MASNAEASVGESPCSRILVTTAHEGASSCSMGMVRSLGVPRRPRSRRRRGGGSDGGGGSGARAHRGRVVAGPEAREPAPRGEAEPAVAAPRPGGAGRAGENLAIGTHTTAPDALAVTRATGPSLNYGLVPRGC